MPHFRNISRRQSSRLTRQEAVSYDEQGWEIPSTFAPSKVQQQTVDSLCTPSTMTHSANYRSLGPDRTVAKSRRRDHAHAYSLSTTYRENSVSFSSSSSYTPLPAPSEYFPSATTHTKSHARRKEEGHIPRPRNAFIFFRSQYCAQQRALFPPNHKFDQNKLSREAGAYWKGLDREAKRPFLKLAEQEKEDHQAKFPNYTYSPNDKGKKKPSALVSRSASFVGRKKSTRVQRKVASSPYPRALSEESDVCDIPRLPTPISSPSHSLGYGDDVMDTTEDVFDQFVPTIEIPPLELSPAVEKEKVPQFSIPHPYYERIDEQFGVKPYVNPTTLDTFLPPIHHYAANRSFGLEGLGLGAPTATSPPIIDFLQGADFADWSLNEVMESGIDTIFDIAGYYAVECEA
ncbi:hypothetical protein BDQ12DRAFT_683892 [Crucibulum laeve]|uniref:HMG box domain-containing protein n=1 Tax=Crucibulum laeve TaxID=68775 RepID=A0A5C3LZT4_9AGAR|nr:hypothetical protein BDQ12DRAFT_683892 [Crucibulum laeve]